MAEGENLSFPIPEPEKVEKAAKETKNMFAQLLKTALYVTGLGKLFDSIGKLADNPAVKVLQAFFEYLVANINAQFVELAKELAKNLFSPESREGVKNMAIIAKGLNDILVMLAKIPKIFDATSQMMKTMDSATSQWNKALNTLNTSLNDLKNTASNAQDRIEKIIKALRDFIEKCEEFYEVVRG